MNPLIQELFPTAVLRNTVGRTENYILDKDAPLPIRLAEIVERVNTSVTPIGQTYATIQAALRGEFGYNEVSTTVQGVQVRVSLALGMSGTAIVREESRIILP